MAIPKILLNDFRLYNKWELDTKGPYYSPTKMKLVDGHIVAKMTPEFLIDTSTDRRYWNESKWCIRSKCFALTLATPIAHSIAIIGKIIFNILKLLAFYEFWRTRENLHTTEHNETKSAKIRYHFKVSLAATGKDLLEIVAAPIALIGLELAAIYGIFRPYDGRKLYATIERTMYGRALVAPCFQPNPASHLLGGDPSKKNTW